MKLDILHPQFLVFTFNCLLGIVDTESVRVHLGPDLFDTVEGGIHSRLDIQFPEKLNQEIIQHKQQLVVRELKRSSILNEIVKLVENRS